VPFVGLREGARKGCGMEILGTEMEVMVKQESEMGESMLVSVKITV